MALAPPTPPPEGPTKVVAQKHGAKVKMTFHFHHKTITKIKTINEYLEITADPRYSVRTGY